jgi:hypothetical protein
MGHFHRENVHGVGFGSESFLLDFTTNGILRIFNSLQAEDIEINAQHYKVNNNSKSNQIKLRRNSLQIQRRKLSS